MGPSLVSQLGPAFVSGDTEAAIFQARPDIQRLWSSCFFQTSQFQLRVIRILYISVT